jgi:hypothetical protein
MAGPYTLTGVIMTHPQRARPAAELAASLGADRVSVVTDPRPDGPRSAFRTTMAAWSGSPPGATHRLVLHDDMVPAVGFWAAAEEAMDEFPHAALALSAFWNSRNGAAVRLGVLGGHRWVRAVPDYTPCTALILPVETARGYVTYAERAGDAWAEDVLMSRYLAAAGVPAYVAAPSLAEHQELRSLSGNDFHGLRRSPCWTADTWARPASTGGAPPEFPVVPFFKFGSPWCVVRTPDGWETIPTERYLARAGHRVEDVEARRAKYLADSWTGPASEVELLAARGAWLTGYALGVVHTGQWPAGELVDRALATIAPGGLCDRLPAHRLAGLERDLADVAADGLAAGLAADPPRPVRRGGSLTLAGTGFPASQLVGALTDLGHAVTLVAPGTRATIECGDRAVRVHGRALRTGDLFGPGMPAGELLPAYCVQALRRQPIVVADDRPLRLVHVDDLVAAVVEALAQPAERDLAPAEPMSALGLAHLVARVVRPVPVLSSAPPPSDTGTSAEAPLGDELAERVRWLAQWLAYEGHTGG